MTFEEQLETIEMVSVEPDADAGITLRTCSLVDDDAHHDPPWRVGECIHCRELIWIAPGATEREIFACLTCSALIIHEVGEIGS